MRIDQFIMASALLATAPVPGFYIFAAFPRRLRHPAATDTHGAEIANIISDPLAGAPRNASHIRQATPSCTGRCRSSASHPAIAS